MAIVIIESAGDRKLQACKTIPLPFPAAVVRPSSNVSCIIARRALRGGGGGAAWRVSQFPFATWERVIVVSHGAAMEEICRHADPTSSVRRRIPNTSISVIHISGDSRHWILEKLGDVGHLNDDSSFLQSAFGGCSSLVRTATQSAIVTRLDMPPFFHRSIALTCQCSNNELACSLNEAVIFGLQPTELAIRSSM